MRIDWNRTRVRLSSSVGRVRCEPGWRLGASWAAGLRDMDLWFVWAGRGRMRLASGEVNLRPGLCFWMRPGGVYLAEQDERDRLGVSFIHFELLERGRPRRADKPLPPEVHDVEDVACVDSICRRVAELIRSRSAEARQAATLLMTGLLADLDASADRPADGLPSGTRRHHRELVGAAATRISESPGAVWSVERLAEQAGYTTDHFARVFRSVQGQTPQEYLVAARVARARQLLIESGLSAKQIARALGYRDVSFFTRQFRQKVGCTPGDYRRRSGSGVNNHVDA